MSILRSATGVLMMFVAADARAESPVDFGRDVRPIFERSCYQCHGAEKQESGYRLDVRDIAVRGGDSGEAPMVPHDSGKSPLVRYVNGEVDGMQMPPEDSGAARLSAEEIATLRSWIDTGPVWPDELAGKPPARETWWSLGPLVRPEVPPIAKSGGPTGNPIDAFLLAALANKRLSASPAAEPRVLVRRVYYDLIGLAPTPQEVETFERDSQQEGADVAYGRLVDKLLDSPRYGEHWARHWLDVAHYADTHGNDHDYGRPNAWPYRDYVIRSLNADKPYQRFIAEQVAGDTLYPEDPQATVALGFLAAGPWDQTLMTSLAEDNLDRKQTRVLDRDDMVATVMSAFQSLTVHCARCHNHKFDPISQREYYALQAVFAGVDRADRPYDLDPAVHLRRHQLIVRKQAIARRDASVQAALAAPETAEKVAAAEQREQARIGGWHPLRALSAVSLNSPDATTFARQGDESWLVGGTRPEKDTFLITAQTEATDIQALRLEVLADDSLPQRGPGRADNGNFHLSEFRASALPLLGPSAGAVRLEFSSTAADHSSDGKAAAGAIDGKADTHWDVDPRYGASHEAVFELKQPLGFAGGSVITIRLEHNSSSGHQIGRFRLSYCTGELATDKRVPPSAPLYSLLRLPASQRTAEERQLLAWAALAEEVERELASLPAPQWVYAATNDFAAKDNFAPSLKPRPVHLLVRGDVGKPADAAAPGALRCLPGLGSELPLANADDESQRRAALARWLADEHNVLTWRSIVNRVWHYHFGRGLVDTPNDFGRMGGLPSHPELLDWLAAWFRDDAQGSLKRLHRLIVTSAAYRQTAAASDAARGADAENRLLGHMNRRRLSAEELHDTLLELSGQLDLAMGGPAAIQFVHDKSTFMPPAGAPPLVDYETFDPDQPANRRRAVYRFIFRTVADPLMDALDCPDGGAVTPVRTTSTTALQSLALLNNSRIIRQCEHLAGRITESASSPEEQVSLACRLVLLRTPSAAELSALVTYLNRHGLANLCQILIASNEFLYID